MEIDSILRDAEAAVRAATDEQALDQVRVQYLGKKGALTALLKGLGALDPEERPKAGAAINEAKAQVQGWIAERKAALGSEQLAAALAEDTVDVTLPGRQQPAGGLHPLPRPCSVSKTSSSAPAMGWWPVGRSKTTTTTSRR